MSMHEHTKPGIYIDDAENIWRKTPDGQWTLNGQHWEPFPKRLGALRTTVEGPAVSIADAVAPIKARYSDIIVETNREAQQVLDGMTEIIEKYRIASVADLYDYVGMTSTFTDQKLGWSDLRGATIERVRNGYLLNLPAPKPFI